MDVKKEIFPFLSYKGLDNFVNNSHTQPIIKGGERLRKIGVFFKALGVDLNEIKVERRKGEIVKITIKDQLIDSIHPYISEIKGLKSLTIRNCDLSHIPEAITKLKKLSYLDLTQNCIPEIPKFLCKINSLRTLKLRHNSLKKIADLSKSNIRSIDLAFTDLETIPAFLKKMENLNHVNLTGNHIKKIDSLGKMGSARISLYWCSIQYVSVSIRRCKCVLRGTIYLGDNPVSIDWDHFDLVEYIDMVLKWRPEPLIEKIKNNEKINFEKQIHNPHQYRFLHFIEQKVGQINNEAKRKFVEFSRNLNKVKLPSSDYEIIL